MFSLNTRLGKISTEYVLRGTLMEDARMAFFKNEFDPALESRLYEWAAWCLDVKNNRVGYPKQSPLVAVIEVGIFCPNFGPREPWLNPRATEVSKWINELSASFPENAEAIKERYFNPRMPMRVLAEAHGVSIRTFNTRVYAGKVWLSGRMTREMSNDNEAAVGYVA